MPEPESDDDEMPRRFLVGALGIFALIFLVMNIVQGKVTFRGNSVSRADHPVGFWMMATFMALAALGFIWWAVHPKDDSEI